MNQSKLESIAEISFNYISGFVVAWAVYAFIIMPSQELKNSAFMTTSVFTFVSVIRSYLWRRFFNLGLHKVIHAVAVKFFTGRNNNHKENISL